MAKLALIHNATSPPPWCRRSLPSSLPTFLSTCLLKAQPRRPRNTSSSNQSARLPRPAWTDTPPLAPSREGPPRLVSAVELEKCDAMSPNTALRVPIAGWTKSNASSRRADGKSQSLSLFTTPSSSYLYICRHAHPVTPTGLAPPSAIYSPNLPFHPRSDPSSPLPWLCRPDPIPLLTRR